MTTGVSEHAPGLWAIHGSLLDLDHQLDGGRKLHADHLVAVHEDQRRALLDHVVRGVTQGRRRDLDLVVRLVVHQHVVGTVPVQELHGALVDDGPLDLLARPERPVHDRAGSHVAERGPHEGVALAGLDVLEVHHLNQVTVQLQRHPVLQVIGCDGRHLDSGGVRLGWLCCGGRASGPWSAGSQFLR